jgi:hypothetical protein
LERWLCWEARISQHRPGSFFFLIHSNNKSFLTITSEQFNVETRIDYSTTLLHFIYCCRRLKYLRTWLWNSRGFECQQFLKFFGGLFFVLVGPNDRYPALWARRRSLELRFPWPQD